MLMGGGAAFRLAVLDEGLERSGRGCLNVLEDACSGETGLELLPPLEAGTIVEVLLFIVPTLALLPLLAARCSLCAIVACCWGKNPALPGEVEVLLLLVDACVLFMYEGY